MIVQMDVEEMMALRMMGCWWSWIDGVEDDGVLLKLKWWPCGVDYSYDKYNQLTTVLAMTVMILQMLLL